MTCTFIGLRTMLHQGFRPEHSNTAVETEKVSCN